MRDVRHAVARSGRRAPRQRRDFFWGEMTGLTVWLLAVAGHEATQITALAPALVGVALATTLRLAFDFRCAH